MAAKVSLQVRLSRSVDAPSRARELLEDRFVATLDRDELEKARLLASELVTNALVHGTGIITLRAEIDEDRLLVDVIDEGGGFERTARKRDFEDWGGRGLSIVEAGSSRWGIHEGTTHVWFELEHPGPRLETDYKPRGPNA
ncbi:MAG: ATP-binding protein [Actinomycetota bacterium]|nr:ATP-binding protein [Actinomycetota bacterium]